MYCEICTNLHKSHTALCGPTGDKTCKYQLTTNQLKTLMHNCIIKKSTCIPNIRQFILILNVYKLAM